MQELLKNKTKASIVCDLIFLILGIILLISPTTVIYTVTNVVEAVLIIYGIVTVSNYLRIESKEDIFSFGFVQGALCILIAIFLIANPSILINILPVTLGIWMIFSSLTKIQVAIKLSAWGQKTSIWHVFLAILIFTIGIILVCNPFNIVKLVVELIGISLIFYSVIDIIESIGVIIFLNKIFE